MGTSTERLQGPVAERPGDQMMGRSGDVPVTSVIHDFYIQLTNILNLLGYVNRDFTVNCSGEKLREQYS